MAIPLGGTCGVGACINGKVACNGVGPATCDSLFKATSETCNLKDDDCDGQVDVGPNGPACDQKCMMAMPVPCGEWTTIHLAANPADTINTYQCDSMPAPLATKYTAKESYLVPAGVAQGTLFSAQVKSGTKYMFLSRLHGACAPTSGTSVNSTECLAHGSSSISGGVYGQDYFVFDSTVAQDVDVYFTCSSPVP